VPDSEGKIMVGVYFSGAVGRLMPQEYFGIVMYARARRRVTAAKGRLPRADT